MGRLGYQSDAQSSLAVSYNSLESYGASLQDALTRALSALRGDRHPRRRRLPPARHQPAADRERVLRHDPPQARDPAGRAPAARAARARRRVRRGAPAWTSTRSARRHHARARCASSTCSCCTACCATARPTRPTEIAAIVRNKQRVAARGREPGLRLADGSAGSAARRMGRRGARRMRADRGGAGCRERHHARTATRSRRPSPL